MLEKKSDVTNRMNIGRLLLSCYTFHLMPVFQYGCHDCVHYVFYECMMQNLQWYIAKRNHGSWPKIIKYVESI